MGKLDYQHILYYLSGLSFLLLIVMFLLLYTGFLPGFFETYFTYIFFIITAVITSYFTLTIKHIPEEERQDSIQIS